MTKHIEIDGKNLTARNVVDIARYGAKVKLANVARTAMRDASAVVDEVLASGEIVYGFNSSVGVKTGVQLASERIEEFNRRLLRTHHMGHGPKAPHECVRATLVVLLNSMASGMPGVRPLLADIVVAALNDDRTVVLHAWGAGGESDMSPMADIGTQLYADTPFKAGEALALLNSSAYSLGMAALAFHDLGVLLDSWLAVSALSMEGYAANPSITSEAALESKPFIGVRTAGELLHASLQGSYLFEPGGPRKLQDPLCFRSLPIVFGNALDTYEFAHRQFLTEIRGSQCNPVVSIKERKLVAVANFDMLQLSMALDTMRLAMIPVMTSSTERIAKMADSFWSGLSMGLIEEDDIGLPGFNGLAYFHKSLTSEGRLLAMPVLHDLPSSSHSNGNIDRFSMSSLAARRTYELGEMCRSLLAMELIVAAQAVELRGCEPLGTSGRKLHRFVRSVVPYAGGVEGIANPGCLVEAMKTVEFDLAKVLI